MGYKLGFIGCGNMGGALLQAALGVVTPADIAVSEKNEQLLSDICDKYGCSSEDSVTIAEECEYIFLGVKPQVMPLVCDEISDTLKERKTPFTLVSMAAGLSIEKLQDYLGSDFPIIRIMPNTAVQVGEGMILYTTSKNVTDAAVSKFLAIMLCAGRFDEIDERLIDAASALSGCGPAYAYIFMEALADGAVSCGLPRQQALTYAAQTLMGSAKMVLETGDHPGLLKDKVCSPGGTTIAGVRALEENGFRGAAMDAVIGAYERTLELGK
ncbi:MAG: pyrroline-5-carboxylate reductase [Ruminococcaceae bacterium]|nr:pyrroline-5-carboxylate reductase [Oscillospiraceae bacterium]